MLRSAPLRLVLSVATLQVVSVGPCVAQAGDRPVLSPLPAASSVKTAADGARILRQLYFTADFNDGAALGDTLNRRFPESTRLHAWYVGNVARTVRASEALALTAHVDTMSREPWVLASRAFALMFDPGGHRTSAAQAVRLAARAHSLSPRDPDFAWLTAATRSNAAQGKWGQVIAYVDSIAPGAGSSELQVVRANALYFLAFAKPPTDTAMREQAFRAYAAVRAMDSTNFNAIYFAADRLVGLRNDEATALLVRAIERSPRSAAVRTTYWNVINARKDVPIEERAAQVAEDRSRFLVLTDSAPWALSAVISSMQYPKREAGVDALEARLLARSPRSGWTESVLLARTRQWAESLRAERGPDSVAAKLRYQQALEEFLDRPWHVSSAAVGEAAIGLFMSVRDDSTYPSARLVKVVKLMAEDGFEANVGITHLMGAVALADRKVEFPYAERLVRAGGKIADENIMSYPDGVFSSNGEREDALFASDAQGRDALGWIYFNEGRLADADKEFDLSLGMSKKSALTYYHLGRLRAAQGRAEDAELEYAQGMTVRFRGVNPNLRELELIYQKNHGSMDGWSTYLASLEEKERTARRVKILATQEKDPKLARTFHLANLEGRTISSDSLKGRYVVVNFWGTWCGPCVAEMPELQQFYDKYRADSSVTVLTVSNDKDLQDLKDWMVKRKFTIPTLWDSGDPGYVGAAGVARWPTTWFIDRDGNVQFTAVGNTGALVEEWSWRLDALRAKPAAVVPQP